jgi:Copper transport outer membrane protein, MctB
LISFRFHIVSIVAVFLALAIGIVVGSTVIDRAIVEGLRNRVDEVSDNLDQRRADNDRLSEQVDGLEGWITEAGPAIGDDRLSDTVSIVVTEDGVDRDPVDATTDMLTEAGSTVRGVLTLDPSWALDDPELQAGLAEAVSAAPDDPVPTLQQRAADLLVADLSSPIEVVDDETGALDALANLGLVDYEAVNDVVIDRPGRVQFVLVTGPESELGEASPIGAFATAAADVTDAVVAAEVFVEQENGPQRGESLAPILDTPELAQRVSTVDMLDLVPGPVTAALALVEARAGTIGHYGMGEGADAPAPSPLES